MEVKDTTRVYLNIMKGIAIFLMIWGHCVQYCSLNNFDFFENVVFKTIYTFHMPLFMSISGYLFFYSFSKRKLSELISYKLQSILHPIIMCTILNFLLKQVANLIFGRSVNLFGAGWINELGSLWFLWSLLISIISVAVSCKITDKVYKQIILLVIIFAGLSFFFPNLSLNLYMYPYFIIGFYFAKYKERIPTFCTIMKYISLLLFPIMVCFFQKKHYIYITGFYSSKYGIVENLCVDFYRWIIGLIGVIFILTVVEMLFKLLNNNKKTNLLKPLYKLGENSLQIYCLSVSLLSYYLPLIYEETLKYIEKNIFVINMNMYNFVFTLILAIIYAIVLYSVALLIKKIKCNKIIFGR